MNNSVDVRNPSSTKPCPPAVDRDATHPAWPGPGHPGVHRGAQRQGRRGISRWQEHRQQTNAQGQNSKDSKGTRPQSSRQTTGNREQQQQQHERDPPGRPRQHRRQQKHQRPPSQPRVRRRSQLCGPSTYWPMGICRSQSMLQLERLCWRARSRSASRCCLPRQYSFNGFHRNQGLPGSDAPRNADRCRQTTGSLTNNVKLGVCWPPGAVIQTSLSTTPGGGGLRQLRASFSTSLTTEVLTRRRCCSTARPPGRRCSPPVAPSGRM